MEWLLAGSEPGLQPVACAELVPIPIGERDTYLMVGLKGQLGDSFPSASEDSNDRETAYACSAARGASHGRLVLQPPEEETRVTL